MPRPERRRFAAQPEDPGHPDAPAPAPAPLGTPRQLGERRLRAAPSPEPPPPDPPVPVAPHVPPHASSRLERLGLMTAGVAHDFNNVLSVILVCAGEITAATNDPEQRARATEITDAAQRGAELSRRLLTHERLPEPDAEPIAIDAAIVDALPIVQRTLGAGIELSLSAEGHLPHVLLAPGELERMLINLAANSRDAMPQGGAVGIRAARVSIPPTDPVLGAGWCVRVSFTDTGAGMTPDVARKALQPYFSTKGGSGSGLGLATVQGLLRARDGDLRVSTVLGSGAMLSLYMPAVTASGEALSLPATGVAAPA